MILEDYFGFYEAKSLEESIFICAALLRVISQYFLEDPLLLRSVIEENKCYFSNAYAQICKYFECSAEKNFVSLAEAAKEETRREMLRDAIQHIHNVETKFDLLSIWASKSRDPMNREVSLDVFRNIKDDAMPLIGIAKFIHLKK